MRKTTNEKIAGYRGVHGGYAAMNPGADYVQLLAQALRRLNKELDQTP